MATQITLTFKRNMENFEKIKAELMLEGPSTKIIGSLRQMVWGLQRETLQSNSLRRRSMALNKIIKMADGFREQIKEISQKSKKKKTSEKELESGNGVSKIENPVNSEELKQCFDVCHFALEAIAQQCDDLQIRNKAFDYIRHNSIALKLTCALARHEDIRKRALAEMPKKPNIYYSWIGRNVESESSTLKVGISRRILAHLKKGEMDDKERKGLLRDAGNELKDSIVKWGKTIDVIAELKRIINETRVMRKLPKINNVGLAKYVESYLASSNGVVPRDYTEALDKIMKSRMVDTEEE